LDESEISPHDFNSQSLSQSTNAKQPKFPSNDMHDGLILLDPHALYALSELVGAENHVLYVTINALFVPATAVAMRICMRQCVECSDINLIVRAAFPRYLTRRTRKYCRERKENSSRVGVSFELYCHLPLWKAPDPRLERALLPAGYVSICIPCRI
jgi:hypothetical protein